VPPHVMIDQVRGFEHAAVSMLNMDLGGAEAHRAESNSGSRMPERKRPCGTEWAIMEPPHLFPASTEAELSQPTDKRTRRIPGGKWFAGIQPTDVDAAVAGGIGVVTHVGKVCHFLCEQ